MNILIVEDHPVFREIIRKILSDWFPTTTVTLAANGAIAVQQLRSQLFTHVVLDLQMPDIDGFALTDLAIKYTPDIRIIAVTSHCDDYTVYRAEKLRIKGFVDKRTSTAFNFHQAIANVEVDLTYYSPSFQKITLERKMNPRSFDKILSDREIEILALLAAPFDDREIAAELRLSTGTVEKHRFNILRKLGLSTTTELMRFARARGIVRAAASLGCERPDTEKFTNLALSYRSDEARNRIPNLVDFPEIRAG